MTKTILIAEDDPANRTLFRDILQLEGYAILEAGHGRDAVDLARERRPDLILMDVKMPVLDGLSAVRILKADPATRTIPVIAVSAFAMEKDEERAMAAGCDAYITKPFGVRILRERVSAHLGPGKPRNTNQGGQSTGGGPWTDDPQ
jgi:two-component system cell cycle response regulator DivK